MLLRMYAASSLLPAGLAAAALIWCSGCGSEAPVTPGEPLSREAAAVASISHPAGWADFYPLEVGNRWTYSRSLHMEEIFDDENVPPMTFADSGTVVREIFARRADKLNTIYKLERETTRMASQPDAPYVQVIGYRQDRTGLYEYDGQRDASSTTAVERAAPATLPPPPSMAAGRAEAAGRQPGLAKAWERLMEKRAAVLSLGRTSPGVGPVSSSGAPAGGRVALSAGDAGPAAERFAAQGDVPPERSPEIVRLSYPLHPGQAWAIRTDPLFLSGVEAFDVLQTPAGRYGAWRVFVAPPGVPGPHDHVHLWFGRSGLIRESIHLETRIEDTVYGRGGGVLRFDEEVELTSLSLVTAAD